MSKHPAPWSVLNSRLRPKPFDQRIIEILDATGKTIIPWGGFDQAEGSHTEKLKLAQRICRAVNAAERP